MRLNDTDLQSLALRRDCCDVCTADITKLELVLSRSTRALRLRIAEAIERTIPSARDEKRNRLEQERAAAARGALTTAATIARTTP